MKKISKSDNTGTPRNCGVPVKYAIVVAAGKGLRAGGEIPKQFQLVREMPMFVHSLRKFFEEDPKTHIVLVVPKGEEELVASRYESYLENYCAGGLTLVEGGDSRTESVEKGLLCVSADIAENGADADKVLVAVHDSARPNVSVALIRRCWEMSAAKGAAIPVIPVADSLRKILEEGEMEIVNRDELRIIQTPQVFRARWIIESYGRMQDDVVYTDDASVVERLYGLSYVEGETVNFKVTRPEDFLLADNPNLGL